MTALVTQKQVDQFQDNVNLVETALRQHIMSVFGQTHAPNAGIYVKVYTPPSVSPYTNSDNKGVGNIILVATINTTTFYIPGRLSIPGPAMPGPTPLVAQLQSLFLVQPAYKNDAAPSSTTFTGVPSKTYNVTVKVRGVMELKNYSGHVSGSVISASPVPPNLSTPQFCFQFTGALNAKGQVWGASRLNEFFLVVSNPAAIYCLNTGTSAAKGVSQVADYTFNFQVTTDETGSTTLTLHVKTIGGDSAPNNHHLTISDNIPPFQSSIVAAQATLAEWVEVDAIRIGPV
jgi:hypothetical protein